MPIPARRNGLSPSTNDSEPGLQNAPAVVRARKRQADAWIGDDVDFSVQRRGARQSRTIELDPVKPPEPEPDPRAEAWDRRREASARAVSGLAATTAGAISAAGRRVWRAIRMLARLGDDPMDVAKATATEFDKVGAAVGGKAVEVGDKAKEVGEEVAAVAQAGADRVNHVRRAGLAPARDRHLEQPRITAPVNVRRPRRKLSERIGSHPDRIVLWAVALGIFLIVIAWTSSSNAQAAKPKLGDRVLVVGSAGYDVRVLHRKLKTGGFYRYKVSSRYTKRTRTGVTGYQRSRCIKADGVVGKATAAALRARKASCVATPSAVQPAASVPQAAPDLGARALQPGMTGNDVRILQKLLGITQTSVYDDATTAAVRALQQSAGLAADGVAGPLTFTALGNRMPTSIATWYGPGFFGRQTACGQTLTPTTAGVAHQTLPCGTEVVFFHNGRFESTTVIDRGPYAHGASWDLTQQSAADLGVMATVTLRAAY